MAERTDEDGASSHRASSSRLLATPTKRAKRLEQRKSFSYSPYPKGSPRTPARRAIGESSLITSPRSQPNTPQSPAMRALSSIVSLLTPFGMSRQARTSAAFGESDLSATVDEDEIEQQQEEETRQVNDITEESMDQSMDEPQQQSIYPALPSKQINPPAFASISSNTNTIEPITKQQSRQSMFYSSALRHSTPLKTGFGGLASSATHQVIPPSASVFTFGDRSHVNDSSAPSLPSYPRMGARSKLTSPLAKNYDLLARFFAEKAEQSTLEEDAPSAASLEDGEPGGGEGGLTEIEVAGCMRLIEESLAQGRAGELERLRGDALERASLLAGTPHYMEESPYTRGYMSRSPSLPLGAAAGEMSGSYGMRSRPSSSFLSPSYQIDDARVNRSLATTFGSNSVPAKRRHRPLYLGPGQGASAASSLLRRNQQTQQQRKTMASRSHQLTRSPHKPIWHREEVDQEDRDASGSNAKRQRREVMEEAIIPVEQPRSISSSQSLPAFSFGTTPSFASPPTPAPSVPDDDEQAFAPPRTATADAMLSILSSGPSIPVRKVVPPKVPIALDDDDETSMARPEIINPYQTRSRLTKRTSAAPGAISLAAKEKERLKEEREKRQRINQETKPKAKESAIKVPESSDSTQASRRNSRRTKVQEEDDERKSKARDAEEKKKKEDEQKKRAEAENSSKIKKLEEEEAERSRKIEAEEAEKHREQERERKTDLVKKKMEQLAKQSATPASSPTPATETSVTSPTTSSAPRKSLAFGSGSLFAPKKPSPLSQADNITPDSPSSSSDASERDAIKPFSFLATPNFGSQSTQAPVVKVTATPSIDSEEKSPREQALAALVNSLPKFDFAVDFISSSVVIPSNESSRAVAKDKDSGQLPVFELFEKRKDGDAPVKPISTTPSTFSFDTSASTPNISKESSVEPSSEAESESKATDSNASALLSGQGEGEENEDCLHEVRSKIWTLKDGKWVDLGIGLFKIKKNQSDGKKRILVRNVGNGKVIMNFRLMESFKPIKDKSVVSFLGFDGEGKPTNYRCKVKTDDFANELAGALQREAIS